MLDEPNQNHSNFFPMTRFGRLLSLAFVRVRRPVPTHDQWVHAGLGAGLLACLPANDEKFLGEFSDEPTINSNFFPEGLHMNRHHSFALSRSSFPAAVC